MKTLSTILISLLVMLGLLTTSTAAPDDIAPAGLAIGVRQPYSIGGVHVLHTTESGPSAAGGQYWNQDHPEVEGVAVAGDKFGDALVWGDFDGNGFPDLAIGNPKDSEGNGGQHGSVNVLYSTPEGLSATGSQYFDQEILGVGNLEVDDLFGFSLAVGDFDNDGFDDVAVGVPYENIDDKGDAGHINMLYGSPAGLVGRDTYYTQDTISDQCKSEQGDRFGYALAAGNFDNDEYDDLAVGVPFEYIESTSNAGVVNVLFGTSNGLEDRDSMFSQDRLGIPSYNSENPDKFGYSLAAGDLNGDGFSDLVIGSPGKSMPDYSFGGLNVMYGSTVGLTTAGAQWFDQDSPGVHGVREAGDQFGFTLAVGDLDGDTFDDLLVGVPFEDIGTTRDAGIVNIYNGTSSGLEGDDQWIDREATGLGETEAYDMFGISLAIWPFPFPYTVKYTNYLPLMAK